MASFLQSSDYYYNNYSSSSDNHQSSCLSCFGGFEHHQGAAVSPLSVPISHLGQRQIRASGSIINGNNNNNNNNNEEMKQTEDYLSSELNKLTAQERAKAQNDLHCVGEDMEETPELIDQSLLQFDLLVKQQLMKNNNNPCYYYYYKKACQQNSAFVENPLFRLRFLRCNLFDVHRSVGQMMDFLKHKATYYGEDKLAREITLDDLSEEDMDLMLSGLYHIQDGRDRTGRVILYVMTDMLGRCKIENLIHVAYYIWNNIMIPIPEVQTKGVVGVYYDVTKPAENLVLPGFNFMLTLFNVLMSFPLRYSAMHVFPKSGKGKNLALNNSLIRFSMNLFPEYARVRTRLHYGTDMEVQYSLRGHGFPIESCPVDINGNIRRDILNTWFSNHKKARVDAAAVTQGRVPMIMEEEINEMDLMSDDLDEQLEKFEADFPMSGVEQQNELATGETNNVIHNGVNNNNNNDSSGGVSIIVPTGNDVLLGRGRGVQHHEGNVRFRKMLEAYRLGYDRTPRKNRRQYSATVTRILLGNGIRFLEKNENGEWTVSSFDEADRKVGQLFRTLRKKA